MADETGKPVYFVHADGIVRLIVTLAWGAAFLAILFTGKYLLYIRSLLWPIIAAGGALFLVMAVRSIFRLKAAHVHDAVCRDNPAMCGAAYAFRKYHFEKIAIILVPLLIAFAGSSGGLTGSLANKQRIDMGGSAIELAEVGEEAMKGEASETDLLSLATEIDDWVGKVAAVEGIVMRNELCGPGDFVVIRFVMICCAACAQPVGAYVECPDAAKADAIPIDQWVRVTGAVGVKEIKGDKFIYIKAREIERIEEPRNPYID